MPTWSRRSDDARRALRWRRRCVPRSGARCRWGWIVTTYRKPDGRTRTFLRKAGDTVYFERSEQPGVERQVTALGWALIVSSCEHETEAAAALAADPGASW